MRRGKDAQSVTDVAGLKCQPCPLAGQRSVAKRIIYAGIPENGLRNPADRDFYVAHLPRQDSVSGR
jgi:hypothetical protein